jgi:hypothetical protein
MKKAVPVAIAFLSGLAMILAFFLNPDKFGNIEEELLQWATIIAGFTLLLGVVSILRVNWRSVKRFDKGWFNKAALLIALFATAIPSIIPTSWSPLFGRGDGSIYDWLFTYPNAQMQSTMFAMLAFYIASAAYRAFRARTTEATLLLITAIIVMLWRVPMGESLFASIYSGLPNLINTYVMGGVNVAVQRGIIIGGALGASATSLRVILGIERTYMGRN